MGWMGFASFALAAGVTAIVIRVLGLSIPRSRTLKEFIWRCYMVYSPDIDRALLVQHFTVGAICFLVVFLTALATLKSWFG
jgi:hypothetical protein